MVRTSRIALLTGLSALALNAAPAFAQDTPPAPVDEPSTGERIDPPAAGEEIVITGTRRTDRTVADSPVPVDVIGAEAIVNSGQTETNKILNQLVPSFNFPQPSIADGSDALRPATLRGLSPDQTLVLINGKRRHVSSLLNINGTVGRGSAAVDMNLIPGLAIGRVEVLRDGAAAQYGSDAIAGVINIQLKNSSHGGRASVTWGKYFTTVDNVANVTGLQLNGSGQPQLDPADNRYFLANSNGDRDADDGRQVTMGVNVGIPMGPNGYFNVTGEFRDRNRTNRAGFDLRPNYNRPAPPAFDAREISFNRLQFRFGDPDTVDYNLLINSGLELGGDWELYAFGTYGHRDTVSAANWRQQSAAANRDFSVLLPNQTPNAANFVALTSDGFLPLIDTDLDDMAGTIGLRTSFGGWKTDLSLGHGQNRFDYTVRDTLNTSFGPQSQRVFDAGGLFYAQDIVNLDFSRQYAIGGFAKPLSIAAGTEYRKEHFEIRPGDVQSYATGPFFRPSFTTTAANCATQQGVFNAGTGVCSFPGRAAPAGAQGFPGIPAASETDVGRHSWAAYVELDADPIEGVTTTIAGRYEHFSDFGSTWNGKFAARWEPVDGFALRGSVSNGFRAPSLHQQFFTTTSTNFIAGLPVDISTLAVNSPVAVTLGSQPLKPEKSFNVSLGATANPMRGLTITADLYQIKIKDRIVLTENLGAAGSGTAAQNAAVKAILDANGFQSVGAARFFINGLDTTTRGIDVVAVYRTRMAGFGNWSLSAAYNYNKTRIDERINALGPLATIPGLVLFGRVEGLRFTEGQPRDKIVFSADGDIGNFGITARTTRYGKVVSPGAAAPLGADATSLTAFGPDDIFLKAKWITDLEFRYKAVKGLELAIGANNLFDVYPTRSPFGPRPAAIGGVYPANQEYIPYSIFSPFGFNGRFLYGRASIEF
ncbi:MAG TPA: TonB-dependent receptor [Allosphingosinicella sp.]|jgi:iron complex outermembrane receptor protein